MNESGNDAGGVYDNVACVSGAVFLVEDSKRLHSIRHSQIPPVPLRVNPKHALINTKHTVRVSSSNVFSNGYDNVLLATKKFTLDGETPIDQTQSHQEGIVAVQSYSPRLLRKNIQSNQPPLQPLKPTSRVAKQIMHAQTLPTETITIHTGPSHHHHNDNQVQLHEIQVSTSHPPQLVPQAQHQWLHHQQQQHHPQQQQQHQQQYQQQHQRQHQQQQQQQQLQQQQQQQQYQSPQFQEQHEHSQLQPHPLDSDYRPQLNEQSQPLNTQDRSRQMAGVSSRMSVPTQEVVEVVRPAQLAKGFECHLQTTHSLPIDMPHELLYSPPAAFTTEVTPSHADSNDFHNIKAHTNVATSYTNLPTLTAAPTQLIHSPTLCRPPKPAPRLTQRLNLAENDVGSFEDPSVLVSTLPTNFRSRLSHEPPIREYSDGDDIDALVRLSTQLPGPPPIPPKML